MRGMSENHYSTNNKQMEDEIEKGGCDADNKDQMNGCETRWVE